jgi:hypothetical protein
MSRSDRQHCHSQTPNNHAAMSVDPNQSNTIHRGLEFGIANFKAFGPKLQSIKLKPLTLVFGPNSAGKSSLVHSLLWANQVLSSNNPDVRESAIAHGQLDLGGFLQIQHHGDGEGDVVLQLVLPQDQPAKNASEKTMSVTLKYGTAPLLPNLWKYALDFIPETLEKLGRENPRLTDEETCAKLVILFHARWIILRLLKMAKSEDLGLEVEDVGGHKLTQEKCPSIAAIWERHREIAEGLTSTKFDEYEKCVQESDWKALIPTIRELGVSAHQVGNEITAFCAALTQSILLVGGEPIPTKPRLTQFALEKNGKIVLEAKQMEDGLYWLTRLEKKLLPAKCRDWPAPDIFHRFFHLEFEGGLPVRVIFDKKGFEIYRRALSLELENESLPDLITAFLGMIIKGFVRIRFENQFARVEYISPIRTVPARHRSASEARSNPGDSWGRLLLDNSAVEIVNHWLSDDKLKLGYALRVDHLTEVEHAQRVVAEQLEKEFLWIYRNITEGDENHVTETYINSKIGPMGNQMNAELAAAFSRGECDGTIERHHPLAATFTFGCQVREFEDAAELHRVIDKAGVIQRINDALEYKLSTPGNALLRLEDSRTGVKLALQDVGVGISQVLPLLVHCATADNTLILIEQPELHVHPALQAELGDLFIESALKRQNTLVLETHSEHLILRMLRRIRETTAAEEEAVRITPEDVAVLYVKPGPDGSEVIELPVTPDGDFSVPWPDGFFPERAKELF